MTVLRPQGPIAAGDAGQLAEQLAQVLSEGHETVIDLSKVAFVDSRGLEVLVDATEQLIRSDRVLKLAEANEVLREVLELTELASLFEFFDHVNAAVGSQQ